MGPTPPTQGLAKDPCLIAGCENGYAFDHKIIKQFADSLNPANVNMAADALTKAAGRVHPAAERLHRALQQVAGAKWTGAGAESAGTAMGTYAGNVLDLARTLQANATMMDVARDSALAFKTNVPPYTEPKDGKKTPAMEAYEWAAREIFNSAYTGGYRLADSSLFVHPTPHNPVAADAPAPGPATAGPAAPGPASTAFNSPASVNPAAASPAHPDPAANPAAHNPAAQPAATQPGQNPAQQNLAQPAPTAPASTTPASVTPTAPGSPVLPLGKAVTPGNDRRDWLNSPVPGQQNPPNPSSRAAALTRAFDGRRGGIPGMPGMGGLRPARQAEEDEKTHKTPEYLKHDKWGLIPKTPPTTPPVLGL